MYQEEDPATHICASLFDRWGRRTFPLESESDEYKIEVSFQRKMFINLGLPQAKVNCTKSKQIKSSNTLILVILPVFSLCYRDPLNVVKMGRMN